MKRIILLLALALSIGLLAGCLPTDTVGTLTLSVPDSAYPPCEVTLIALGVDGGQFTFSVEGKTYTQTSRTLVVTVNELPIEVTVTWISGDDAQTATETIWLQNVGPVPGRPVLNAITNLWTIHPRSKYIVTFPYAVDPEGGPVTLIDVRVQYVGYADDTVFCPPFTGENPPKPDEYHVRMPNGALAQNAFMLFSMWFGPVENLVTLLPYSPPDYGVKGYPGGGTCGLAWPRGSRERTDTIITATFEDEMGATTTDSWTIPTNPYPGCGVQTASSTL